VIFTAKLLLIQINERWNHTGFIREYEAERRQHGDRVMKMRIFAAATLATAIVTGPALVTPASAAPGIAAGILSCNVSSGWGFVFGSSRSLNCTLTGTNGNSEHYTGNITKFGADIGYTSGGVIVWTVFAPQAVLMPGALNGGYAGGTASATVGVGVGAHALIGGSGNTIALQPLSLEGNTGLNVAAGIGAITLTQVP
jgi:hypothetical protein